MIIVHRSNFILFSSGLTAAYDQLSLTTLTFVELKKKKKKKTPSFYGETSLKSKRNMVEITTQHFNKMNMEKKQKKQSEAFKCGMVITRSIWGGRLLFPALASPAPAANEECLSRRGAKKHCRNSLLSDVTNTLQIFYAIFLFIILPFFVFLKFLKISESQQHLCLSISTGKKKEKKKRL